MFQESFRREIRQTFLTNLKYIDNHTRGSLKELN